jgi:hypothetical protein
MSNRPSQEKLHQCREGHGYRYRVTSNDPRYERFTHPRLGRAGGFWSLFKPRHYRSIGLPQLRAPSHAGCRISSIRLAGALVTLGQGERAARLYGAAEALRELTGTPIQYAGHQALYERQVAALGEQLDAETIEAAWAEGRTMTLEEAVGEALAEST